MTDGTDVVAGSVLLPSGGTALDREPGERRCKRPGCGNLVPVSGRGRIRCSAVMRARVVSITLRGLRAVTGTWYRRGRLLAVALWNGPTVLL